MPKKIYFQIENNLFYEPEKYPCNRRAGRNRKAAAQSAAKRTFSNGATSNPPRTRNEPIFRLPCVLWQPPSLNSLFSVDPILIGRQLSKNGTARLASWENNNTCAMSSFKENGHKEQHDVERIHSTDRLVRGNRKTEPKPNFVSKKPETHTPKHISKPCFDLSANLSHSRQHLSQILHRASSMPSSQGSKDIFQNAISEPLHRSSLDLHLEPCGAILPRNPLNNVVINIPVLGFRKCGRTSLLNSLVQTKPLTNHKISDAHPTYYYPMVVFNDQVFHFRLIDCPMLMQDFPISTLDAWLDFRGWGLHLADFFILVFDITDDTSFQYIKLLRDQIIAAKMDVPMVIVANKIDLLKRPHQVRGARFFESSGSVQHRQSRLHGRVFSRGHVAGGSGWQLDPCSKASALYQPQISITLGNYHKMAFRRDLALLVKKHWKQCVLVECSALYNFNTLVILKEVMRFVQYRQFGPKPTTAQAVQAAWKRNHCCIL